mmetsp:Transcript_20319/g.9426  ORF Transcript_20319/g.9426 Transcript_20319/m.9426 type:complete len:113 (-) Transcript_20319:40-378(-)
MLYNFDYVVDYIGYVVCTGFEEDWFLDPGYVDVLFCHDTRRFNATGEWNYGEPYIFPYTRWGNTSDLVMPYQPHTGGFFNIHTKLRTYTLKGYYYIDASSEYDHSKGFYWNY